MELAVCRLLPDTPIPAWATSAPFFCVMRTAEELSVVCPASALPAHLPDDVKVARTWRALKLHGPFDFAETGVLASVLSPLAAAVSIFALATYDTDYVLVRQPQLERAIEALRAAGHTVTP